MALDIPEAAGVRAAAEQCRRGGRRSRGAGHRRWRALDRGRTHKGTDTQFLGQFNGDRVYLGELQTDEAGRLRLPRRARRVGVPDEHPDLHRTARSFINADGWYDDISDGPVTAEVTIEGRAIPVEGAWVVTAPPDYAPDLKGVRTLYDLLFDLYVREGWLPFPETVSFRRDVYPILLPAQPPPVGEQGLRRPVRAGRPERFREPRLHREAGEMPAPGRFDTYGELRRQVFNSFRDPDGDRRQRRCRGRGSTATPRKPIPASSPRQNSTISPTQYGYLRPVGGWPVRGRLGARTRRCRTRSPTFRSRTSPAMLDRAALEFCLADAFHPGCEVTWPIRHLTMFSEPFRIRRATGPPATDYGKELTPDKALAPDRAAPRPGAGRPDALDGAPVAGGHGVLPVGLQPGLRPLPPDLLARPRPEPGADENELRHRD